MTTPAFPRRLFFGLLLGTLLLGLGTAPTARGQADERSRQMNNPTYVGEESDVTEALFEARRLEANERYADALDAYIRLVERANRWQYEPPAGQEARILMTAWQEHSRADGRGYYGQTFWPVREVSLRAIAEMPARWRQAYREKVNPAAEALWRQAVESRNRSLVQRVADEYWLTSVGPQAMDLAGQLAFEVGEFQTAAYYWERMQELAEAAFAEQPIRIVKLAAAYYALGDWAGLEATQTAARRRYAGLAIRLGHERLANLVELLEPAQLNSHFLAHTPWVEPRGLQRPGGNDTGTRPAPHFERLLHVHPPLDLTPLFQPDDQSNMVRTFSSSVRHGGVAQLAERNLVNLHVVVYDGWLAIHGPKQMYLLQLADGASGSVAVERRFVGDVTRLLPQSTETPQDNRMWMVYNAAVNAQHYMPVIYRDHVYVVFQPGNLQTDPRHARPGDVLACYPLRSEGAVRWVTPTNSNDPNESHASLLGSLALSPAAAVGNGLVYLGASKAVGREIRYYAIAYDAETGAVQWSQRIASRLSGRDRFGGAAADPVPPAPLVYDAGLVYMQTNTGAIAAIDALTGTTRWVFKYERSTGIEQNMWSPQSPSREQWAHNVPISHGGVAYFTPIDSSRLLVLLGRTGDFLRQFPTTDRDVDDMEYMLGVVDDCLVVQGRTRVRLVDLRADSRNMVLPSSVRHESTRYALNARELEDTNFVTGRGVVTARSVFIPTRAALLRFDIETGKREADIPWPSELAGQVNGHLFVFQVPDAVAAEDAVNRYPGEALETGTEVELPGGDGVVTVPARRTFLAIVSGDRLHLIEVE